MVRRLATLALLALAAGAACLPAAASGGSGASASKLTAYVKVARCSRVLDEAVFHAKMRAFDGADRMAMRFTLLERTGLDGFRRVGAKGLKWRRSRRGVRVFGHRQAVRNLAHGAVYRARVDFRWYSEEGELLARARRRSATCPDGKALPNLRVRLLHVRHTQAPATERYGVRVSNVGRATADDSLVALSVDGVAAGTASVGTLHAGASRYLTLRGPECSKWAQAQVDPGARIAETDDQDNTHQLACRDLKLR